MAVDAFIKLPEFWEFSQTAWFVQTQAQFADIARYYHVVSVLGRSTATRAASFIANPPNQGKYRDLKAFLLKTFELSQSERAQRLLAIQGLGDSKPSEHMEMMLNLLGTEEPNFLFMELFLQHMPPQVRTALAGARITEPGALAEEADRSQQNPGSCRRPCQHSYVRSEECPAGYSGGHRAWRPRSTIEVR